MTTDKKTFQPKIRSKNEQIVQIYLPLAVFVLIVFATSLAIILLPDSSNSSISQWANISTVLLVIPTLVSLIIFLAITVLLIVGLAKLIKWLPIQTSKIYVIFLKAEVFLINSSAKIVSPVISFKSRIHSIKNVFKKGVN